MTEVVRKNISDLKSLIENTAVELEEVSFDEAESIYSDMAVTLVDSIRDILPDTTDNANLYRHLLDLHSIINTTDWDTSIDESDMSVNDYFRSLTEDWISRIEIILDMHK